MPLYSCSFFDSMTDNGVSEGKECSAVQSVAVDMPWQKDRKYEIISSCCV